MHQQYIGNTTQVLFLFLKLKELLLDLNTWRIREHFMYQQWKLEVAIIQEGPEPIPRCDHCGIHMPVARLIKHIRTEICNKAAETRIRYRDVDMLER